jgi:hypothetical protein
MTMVVMLISSTPGRVKKVGMKMVRGYSKRGPFSLARFSTGGEPGSSAPNLAFSYRSITCGLKAQQNLYLLRTAFTIITINQPLKRKRTHNQGSYVSAAFVIWLKEELVQ